MKFCAFDVETEGRIPTFKSGAIWSDEAQFYSESHREIVEAMRFHARKGYIFAAHNAEYDTSVALWNAGEDVAVHYINDAWDCGYWTWGKGRQRAQIWDTVRLAAGMPLSELGAAIGVPKYPTPRVLLGEDDWRPSWVCDHHGKRECVECYNLRDAEIVWCWCNMMREWLDSYGLKLRRSLPGNAVQLWQMWDINLQQSIHDPRIRALARAAIHGGRCEPFKYGTITGVNTYDIRSHYGTILADHKLVDSGKLRYADTATTWNDVENSDGVIDATVWVEPQHIPPLPATHNDRVYFPVGTVRGAWPISELRNATYHGVQVLRVHRAAWTDKTYYPFRITAAALLDMREHARANDDPRQMIYKFLINAIPGRLGMRDTHTRRIYRRYHPSMTKADMAGADLESVGGALFVAREIDYNKPSRTSNPLWAAEILGQGRARLYEYLILAGKSLCYCDTDSVHSTSLMFTGADTPGSLVSTGFWDHALYIGAKLYRLTGPDNIVEVKARGIPQRHAESYMQDGHARYQTTLSVREAVKAGMPAGTWIDVDRTMQYGIGYRTIHDPTVLRDRSGYSPTSPVVFSSDYDGTITLTNDRIASD